MKYALTILSVAAALLLGAAPARASFIETHEQVTYSVHGHTPRMLERAMTRNSPFTWWGYTTWRVDWTGRDVTLHTIVYLPSWEDDCPGPLAVKWVGFLRGLEAHEQGHVAIARRWALGVANGEAPDLGSLEAAEESYDGVTVHGLAQMQSLG